MARLLSRPGVVDPAGPDVAPCADAVVAARRSARRWALLLAVGWLAQAGLRAWFSRGQTVPLANPDESAYLIAARVLTGGAPANFSYYTLYPGGYPLLIAPVYWFTHNPVTVYRAVLLGINAPVSALIGLKHRLPQSLSQISSRMLSRIGASISAAAMMSWNACKRGVISPLGSPIGNFLP